MKRRLATTGAVLGVLLLIGSVLSWPAATWLEARECWAPAGSCVDAIYILAGNTSGARADGVVAWLQDGGRTGRILLSHDPAKGSWSRRDQRNLTMGEWALRNLSEGLVQAGLDVPVEVISLDMRGTDAEVASLARLVDARPDVESIALATSRFHVRRTQSRAERYFDEAPRVIPGDKTWDDRSPWVVGVELLKMLRDRLGLTRVVSRRLWMDGQAAEDG